MKKEERPAWLETLWNVNPSLARKAEKDMDILIAALAPNSICPECGGLTVVQGVTGAFEICESCNKLK